MKHFGISYFLVGLISSMLLLSSMPVCIGTAGAAERFSSRELGFRINFPVQPQAVKSEKQTASGLTRMVRYRAKDKVFRTALTVVTFDHRPFTRDEAALGLKLSRDNQVRGLKGELISEKDIAIDGYPGKELHIAFGPPGKPRNYRYRVRTYYVQNRQYLMSIIGTEKLVSSQRSDDYFGSFALIQQKKGAAQ